MNEANSVDQRGGRGSRLVDDQADASGADASEFSSLVDAGVQSAISGSEFDDGPRTSDISHGGSESEGGGASGVFPVAGSANIALDLREGQADGESAASGGARGRHHVDGDRAATRSCIRAVNPGLDGFVLEERGRASDG